ncbi:sugar ABC transporter permease [Paenibacillus sp. WQ 127069]|uniref:Sugar ABC transporter permease n=1 Tax=Paenibacillus baimaensis TaxID=2982185 RepID=A0ABT2UKB3_9BACL|nr:sugar ABC transporter permease [Paenibacillus sp. WQ 127069]MCU6795080.1 sugar ABC transporter permease [Paenibacillus sp. WQ 127069]
MQTRSSRYLPYLFIFPNVFIYFIFVLIPVIWVLYLSFTNYTLMNPGEWIGLKNYSRIIQDSIFLRAIRNTLFFWICTVIPTMALGMFIAQFLNLKIRFIAAFRASIYLPGVISSVAVAMTWLWLLDPMKGPVNVFLTSIGMTGENWLQDPKTALGSIIIIGIWTGIGYAMIIYLAGLQGIPEHLYEAAKMDGANTVQQFIAITLPLLRPITFFLFITSTIRSFQIFDLVYILTSGGPANSTTTLVNEIVKMSFSEYRMGYASTMAMVLLIITLIVTLINYTFGSRDNDID